MVGESVTRFGCRDQKDVDPKNKSIFSPRRNRTSNDNHYAGL